jgi:hypothetical protein
MTRWDLGPSTLTLPWPAGWLLAAHLDCQAYPSLVQKAVSSTDVILFCKLSRSTSTLRFLLPEDRPLHSSKYLLRLR